jgi:hypothetical protein
VHHPLLSSALIERDLPIYPFGYDSEISIRSLGAEQEQIIVNSSMHSVGTVIAECRGMFFPRPTEGHMTQELIVAGLLMGLVGLIWGRTIAILQADHAIP